ncbi:MAG TPA: GAF domain-containing protein [Acidimicrobiales bacterium]|nr:GAF domain-containing protein [Acidimicrobiales bacterium]
MRFGRTSQACETRALTVERDTLLVQARLVGLGGIDTPTLEAVERRRIQVWTLAILTLMGVSAILVLGRVAQAQSESANPATTAVLRNLDWSHNAQLQALLVALVVGMAVYVIDRERRLRQLTRLLIDERALTAALVQRLAEVRTLLGVAKAMNSSLGLDAILGRIADAATTMLYAERGEVLLTDGEVLRVVAASGTDAAARVGEDRPYGNDPIGHAARTWELVAVGGTASAPPGLYVPILHASQLLGVLAVTGHRSRPFSDYDTRAALLFAEQAAFAIASTHRAEASRWEEAERVELTSHRGELLSGAVSDLRDPLSSMVAVTKMLKRDKLGDTERRELADVLSRQTGKLARSIEEILSAT